MTITVIKINVQTREINLKSEKANAKLGYREHQSECSLKQNIHASFTQPTKPNNFTLFIDGHQQHKTQSMSRLEEFTRVK